MPSWIGAWLQRTGNPMGLLVELADKYGATKRMHGYMPVYERFLAPIREDAKTVLEIGVQSGASLRMWRDYFPRANIIGLDILKYCKKHAQPERRIHVVIGDQADVAILESLPTFDVIIDDGSHIPEDVKKSFELLFPCHLHMGGLYFIEDMETQFDTVNMVAELAKQVNWWPFNVEGRDWEKLNTLPDGAPPMAKIMTAVHVYRFLAIIEKGRNPEDGEAAWRLAQ